MARRWAFGFLIVALASAPWWIGRIEREDPAPASPTAEGAQLRSRPMEATGTRDTERRDVTPTASADSAPTPEPSARELDVLVRTTVQRNAMRGFAPGTELELGVYLWPDERGDPPHVPPERRQSLTTDERGQARVRLSIPPRPEWGQRWTVFARSMRPGTQQVLAWRNVDEDTRELTVNVAVLPGATARGRLVSAHGHDVRGGRAVLRRDEKNVDDDRCDASGAFALHFDADGLYDLRGSSNSAGTGSVEGVVLELARPAQDLELVLFGSGVLAGRVVDPEGRPQEALRVYATRGDVDQARNTFHDEAGPAAGWAKNSVQTDDGGHFRIAGLQPGSYRLECMLGRSPERTLLHSTVPTGTQGLELVVERRALEVTVVDDQGRPTRLDHAWTHGMHEDELPRLAVYCFATDDATRRNVPLHASAPDRFLAFVEAEREYVLGALGRTVGLVEQRLYVPRGSYRIPRTLQLPSPAEPGRLRVIREPPASVQVFSPGGRRIGGLDAEAEELSLPPGEYDVEALGGDAEDGWAGLRKARARASVLAGRVTEVALVLPAPGFLELSWSGVQRPPYPSGYRSVLDGIAWDELALLELPEADELRRIEGGARVRLVAEDGSEPAVLFDLGALAHDWVPPDRPTRNATPLEPGRYELTLEAPGRPPHREQVEIRPGETTRVRVLFSER